MILREPTATASRYLGGGRWLHREVPICGVIIELGRILHRNVNVTRMWVGAMVGTPCPLFDLWTENASVGNYILNAPIAVLLKDICEFIGIKTLVWRMREIECLDNTIFIGVMVRMLSLVAGISYCAIVMFIATGRRSINLFAKSNKTFC